MRQEYPEDSGFYVSRVLGEFPEEGTVDSLVRRSDVEATFHRHDERLNLAAWSRPVLALDVGRSVEGDESVCAVVEGAHVHALHAWRIRDLTVTADRFPALEARMRLECYARSTGRVVAEGNKLVNDPDGDGLARWVAARGSRPWGSSWIRREWAPAWSTTSGAVAGGSPNGGAGKPAADETRFANVRAEAYWRLRTLLEAGEVALPRDERLAEDLVSQEWSQDAKGRIVMLGQGVVAKTLGRSPDRARRGGHWACRVARRDPSRAGDLPSIPENVRVGTEPPGSTRGSVGDDLQSL